MNVTEQISQHIVSTGFEDFDQHTIERAKTRVLDSLGVIAAGAHAPGCDALLRQITRWGGSSDSTVLVHGLKAPAANAATMNSMMMRSYDFEAIEAEGHNLSSSPAHISGTTVPTALAVAEWQNASGKDFLTALVLGDDLASRLGASSGFDLYGGWDNTGTINGLGATAIAGRLLGLDALQMREAFGIVLNQLAGSIDNINDKTLGYKLPISLSSRNAIFSAELAGLGYKAAKDAIGGRKGFFALYCPKASPELLTIDLGTKFFGDVVIKPWSACRLTHPSIDACVQIVSANPLEPADIREVRILATPSTCAGFCGQPFEIGEEPQVSGAFSIRFTAANAILRGTVRPEHFTREKMSEPELQALLGKIALVDALPPTEYLTATVEVEMNDGRVFTARTDVPKGDIHKNPMTSDEVLEKFRANIDFAEGISAEAGERIIEKVARLEDLSSVKELIEPLA